MDARKIFTIEPGKMDGEPCTRVRLKFAAERGGWLGNIAALYRGWARSREGASNGNRAHQKTPCRVSRTGPMGLERGAIRLTIDRPMVEYRRNARVALEVEDADAYYREWSTRGEGERK